MDIKKTAHYLGNPLLKGVAHKIQWTPEMVEEYVKCKDSPDYFARTYMKIVHVDKGMINFMPYDYQDQIIKTVHDSRFTILCCSRQSGKTTAISANILHYIIFNSEKTVALLANKGDTAREILSRIKLAYENLPSWLQQGVLKFNEGSIELENNSRVIATSTSSSAIRGYSISFLYIDECVEGDTVVTILKDGLESSIRIDSLYRNIFKAEIQYKNGYKVLTENGFKSFDGIKRTIAPTIEIIFSDDSNLKCTKSHLIKTNNTFTEAINLNIGDAVGELFVKSISELSTDDRFVYDLLNVEDGHHYITNNVTSHNCAFIEGWTEFYKSVYPTISSGKETKVVLVSTPNGLNFYYKLWADAVSGSSDYIPIKVTWRDVPGRDEEWKRQTIANTSEEAFIQEHEAEFIGSAGTLIDGWRLKELVEETPIKSGKYAKMYETVQENHIYAVIADVSRGKGIDNSAYIVVDVTTLPYKIVSTYYCPVVPPDMFAEFIYQAHIYYNDAYVIVENNDAGCETLRVLNDTYECESILGTMTDNQNRKIISINGGNGFEFGVRTTKTVKAVGCTRAKQLVESGSILFGDKWLIDELNKFIRVGKSYEAQKDAHDDITMCLVIFGWLTTQYLFEDLTTIDTRFSLRNMKEGEYIDDLLPFGYVTDGLDSYGDDIRVDFQSIELPDYEDTPFFEYIQNNRKMAKESDGFFDD